MKATTILVILCAASTLQEAPVCDPNACKLPTCRCSDTKNPIDNKSDPAPQLVAFTLAEAATHEYLIERIAPLFFNRTNHDGSPVGLTFHVNHEFTDYTLVRDFYVRGHEIGVNSLTKAFVPPYWQNASLDVLRQEYCGQKTILSHFARVPEEDITGARLPRLQMTGDVNIDAYLDCNFTYDNSWPALTTNRVLPYTLDYRTTQECTASEHCPTESHPGFWVAPITDFLGSDGIECNSIATCRVKGSADDIARWLMGELDRVRESNRAPIILRLDSYLFDFMENSYEGLEKFLDQVSVLEDVFLVSVSDVLEWMKNPVPVSDYVPGNHSGRSVDCTPVVCRYKIEEGKERKMGSCVPCPKNYPWLGNPLGN